MCGLGLGDPSLTGATMVNLLGDLWDDGDPRGDAVLAPAGAHLHLYGKREPRPGRKMGHITVTGRSPDEAAATAVTCRDNARRRLHLDL